MARICASLKNARRALPWASAQAVLPSACAAAKVTSSKRRGSIGRLISASSAPQRAMISGRWLKAFA